MSEQPSPQRGPQFWRGLAWGVIPLVFFLLAGVLLRDFHYSISLSFLGFGVLACILLLVKAIIHLRKPQQRFIGYGILAMLLVTPVVAVYGCMFIGRIGRI